MKYDVSVKKNGELNYFELTKKPNQAELNAYYAQKYFQESLPKNYSKSYNSNELELINKKLEQRFSAVSKSRKDAHFKTFLDVGCGEGFALNFFLEKGYEVKGLDFSSDGLEQHNPNCIHCFQAGDVFQSLDQEIEKEHKYDVIWLQNVLEHVLEPIDILQKLRRLVSDQGVLVVTIPNDFSALQKRALDLGFIDNHFWVVAPDHISYFNTHNIANVANHSGWQVLDRLADFPIDWFLYNQHSNYINDLNLGKGAHFARLELEILISENSVDDVNDFYRSLATLGMGRNVTVVLAT